MEELRQKFIEDATDLVADLEETLLELEQNNKEREALEKVFRVMHTLKGVSSMYGFDEIGELTHELETIYNYAREYKIEITKEIIEITLGAVDVIRMMLKDQKPTQEELDEFNEILDEVKKYSKNLDNINQQQTGMLTQKEEQTESENTYLIYFKPDEDVLQRGIDPISLTEELRELGTIWIKNNPSKIPPINELVFDKNYIETKILISTNKNEEDIDDVFIFVPDEFSCSQITAGNLLENKDFIAEISTLSFQDLTQENLKQKASKYKIENSTLPESKENVKKATSQNTTTKNKKQVEILEEKTKNIKVASEKLDDLMNLVSELVTTQAELSLIAENQDLPRLNIVSENIEKLTRQLRNNAFNICLIPLKTLIARFNRLIRDLSNELNKEVTFITEGLNTELDKTIIDNLISPLMHLLRNAMDHGIEPKQERLNKNKPEKGSIILRAFHSGASVYIQIEDDGKGIDPEKIKSKAIEKNLIAPNAQLTNTEIYNLIFLPGFSTAQKVTEVSGRGVGMDVVRKRITELRGEIDIESELNAGTTFSIKLPLTLSIVDSLQVKISDIPFLIALPVIESCHDIKYSEITESTNDKLILNGEMLPFVNLREEFEINDNIPVRASIVLVKYQTKKVAIIVDHILGEHQAVLKPLDEMYSYQQIISGASILGDGNVALVIDTNKLLKSLSEKTLK